MLGAHVLYLIENTNWPITSTFYSSIPLLQVQISSNVFMEEDSPIFKKPNRVFLEEYTEYFASVRSSLNIEELLRKFPTKDITYNPNSTFEGVRVEPVSVERRGAVVRFRVDIGGFTLFMVVINVDGRASKICRGRLYQNPARSVVIQERMTMQASFCVSKEPVSWIQIQDSLKRRMGLCGKSMVRPRK